MSSPAPLSSRRPPSAAIEIGSSAIHCTIAQEKEEGWEVLEELTRSVRLGRDAFTQGHFAREVIDETIRILAGFEKEARALGVGRIEAAASSSLVESGNLDVLLDNLAGATGIEVKSLSPQRETEILFLALNASLWKERADYTGVRKAMLKVGSGFSLLTLFDRDKIIAHLTLPLGTVRLRQIWAAHSGHEGDFAAYLKSAVDHELKLIEQQLPRRESAKLFGFGVELECLENLAGFPHGEDGSFFPPRALQDLLAGIRGRRREEIAAMGVPDSKVETFETAVYLFARIAEWLSCERLQIAPVNLRDGLLSVTADGVPPTQLIRQVEADALAIGRSLRFEENHSVCVANMALRLFDLSAELHRLGDRERAWLLAAALLHDVGYAVSYNGHHKHSFYIIQAREFFFIGETERLVIANVARYHRKGQPKPHHAEYHGLPRALRMTVLKLASLLRMAEALDYHRKGTILSLELRSLRPVFLLAAETRGPAHGEIWSLRDKKDLFESLFGVTVKMTVAKEHDLGSV